jgi:invasion protein IalB
MAEKKKEQDTAEVEAQTAENLAEASAARLDETVPGGRYIVNGKTVNADGKEINAKGEVVEEKK